MKQLHLRITPPAEETIPVHRAIQSHESIGDAFLLSGGIDASDPTELFSIRGAKSRVLSALEQQPGIRSVECLSTDDQSVYVYVREVSQNRTIADAFTERTLVVTLPVQFRMDGAVELSVLGSGSDLQDAVRFVRSRADLTVLAVHEGWTGYGLDVLTDRQRTVVRAAYEAGYYDYPRTVTQEDIAAAVGVTAGTVAEHLRKAEQALIEQAIDS